MTGPEHYQEAERLIGIAREAAAPHAGGNKHLYFGARPETAWILAEAQVHATRFGRSVRARLRGDT